MRRSSQRMRSTAMLLLAMFAPGLAAPVQAQGQGGPGPVEYTEALSHIVRQVVRLPGTVESRKNGVVASEVAGLVVDLPVREGDRVRADQTLVRLRDVDIKLRLRAAEGSLAESKARLELARSQLARARELFAADVISQDEMDDAVSEHTAWVARVDSNAAEVDRLGVALYRTEIRAPWAGIVTQRFTEVGQWIQLGGTAVAMVSLRELEVRVDVPERFFARVETGSTVAVEFETLQDLRLAGRIARVIPQAVPDARSFPVKVAIDNRDGRIAVGMLAHVALPVGEPHAATLVPKDSVIQQGSGHSVYRIKSDDTVEPVPVRTGQGVGDWIVVLGPIEEGQRIVTRGNERLQPGQAVRARPRSYPPPPTAAAFGVGG